MYVYAIITTLLQIENNRIIIHLCGCRFFSKHMCFVRGSEEVRENCAFFLQFFCEFQRSVILFKGAESNHIDIFKRKCQIDCT